MAYDYQCPVKTGASCAKTMEILGMGHPLIFWASVLTIPYLAFVWARRHDWRAGLVFVGAIVLAPAARSGYLVYPANLFVWAWALRPQGVAAGAKKSPMVNVQVHPV